MDAILSLPNGNYFAHTLAKVLLLNETYADYYIPILIALMSHRKEWVRDSTMRQLTRVASVSLPLSVSVTESSGTVSPNAILESPQLLFATTERAFTDPSQNVSDFFAFLRLQLEIGRLKNGLSIGSHACHISNSKLHFKPAEQRYCDATSCVASIVC
jgi:hypothetical protein